jgi:hypothetical protein
VPEPWRLVIGVVPDVDHGSPQDGYVNATVYVPYREQAERSAWLLVRTTLGLDAVAAPIRRETQRLDPDLPVGSPRTIRDLLAQDRWTYRMFGALFSGFALIATCLSAAALYTVVAHGVARRTPEFGIRVALGATRRDVVWMVVRQGLQPVAVGVVLGVAGALLVGRTLGGMLVGITSDDAPTLVVVTLTFMAICGIACVQPAVRAMRLNPLDALRTE